MTLHDRAAMQRVISTLTLQRSQPISSAADLQIQLHLFADEAFPSGIVQDRETHKELYGCVKDAYQKALLLMISPEDAWSSQDRILVQTTAFISGILFVTHAV